MPTPSSVTLPLGLPWLGAHFRIDALAAFFLVVINLGGAAASLFALGYGRHEECAAARAAVLSGLSRRHESRGARRRRLHLPGVVGVHVAHLLGAGDRASSRSREPARRLCLSADGELRHAGAAARFRPARRRRRQLRLRRHPRRASVRESRGAGADPGAARRRLESRPRAAACLAAARPSGRAEPCLRADERRDDQGRDLRLRPHRIRPARPRRPGGGAWSCSRSAASPPCWACSMR